MMDEYLLTKWLIKEDPYLARLILLQASHLRYCDPSEKSVFEQRMNEYLQLAEERFDGDMDIERIGMEQMKVI